MRQVIVKDGQSIYDIALQEYGDVKYVNVIYANNPGIDGAIVLDAGYAINIPENPSLPTPDQEESQGFVFQPQQTNSGDGTNDHSLLINRSLANQHPGTAISLDASSFSNNLDNAVVNVQLLAKKVDELPTGGIPEAPNDGEVYARGSLSWIAAVEKDTYSAFVEWVETQLLSTQTTGTEIKFTTPKIYNTASSPATGNITNDLTGARLGVVQKIYHNHTSEPTFPTGWVLFGGKYKTDELNIIYAEWASGTRVEYWIIQEAA